MNLVIVESPTKAKTISKFLGKDYTVKSSMGHVRDLPKSQMGVDIEHNFEPEYEPPQDARKKKIVAELRRLAKTADTIYLASDEDREGEAIAWHLKELLNQPGEKFKRIAFHEITKTAITHALENPRDLDTNLINAQQARRVLDRLVGYELSPLLWKKVFYGLSAGRVQSVAVRFIAEREREIQKFKSESYWKLNAEYKEKFQADLTHINDEKIEETKKLKLFAGDYSYKKTSIDTKKKAADVESALQTAQHVIKEIKQKSAKRNPPAPFTTSSLQQAANNRFGFGAKRTMQLAQKLYETGLITYMRTDSVNLSNEFVAAAGKFIKKTYGEKFGLEKPRFYKGRSKNAQEAHEAIRVTDVTKTPENMKLEAGQLKLYTLIWQRAVATQMAPAEVKTTTIMIEAKESQDTYQLKTTGSVITFPGYLEVYPSGSNDAILPDVKEGDTLNVKSIENTEASTTPPPRYNEASLVKVLEEYGIGRPSTYAPTISTIEAREYVRKEGKAFKPTDTGLLVNDLLVEHFPQIVDIEFTAGVEEKFDAVSRGEHEWQEMMKDFYDPFHQNIEKKDKELNKDDIAGGRELGIDPKSGKPVLARVGRFGPFIQIGTRDDEEKPKFAPIIGDVSIDDLTLDEALEFFKLPRVLGQNEEGKDIKANSGRFGPYVQEGDVYASIKDGDPMTITLDEAKELIKERKAKIKELTVREWPEDKMVIMKGRWNSLWLKKGRKRVRLTKEQAASVEKMTKEEAESLLPQAKRKAKKKVTKKK